ncbi:MAG: hypothetical protein AAF310_03610, partial [Myxococcota bacterium]
MIFSPLFCPLQYGEVLTRRPVDLRAAQILSIHTPKNNDKNILYLFFYSPLIAVPRVASIDLMMA